MYHMNDNKDRKEVCLGTEHSEQQDEKGMEGGTHISWEGASRLSCSSACILFPTSISSTSTSEPLPRETQSPREEQGAGTYHYVSQRRACVSTT